jgi:UDP-N-acetylmuramate: L-alanyl-gamma-D-glutamyl-meso-diaminopimelate ligase
MLGICGTGMGSLALLLKEAGHRVTGTDENVYPPMSVQLEKAGIKTFQGYKPENLSRAGKIETVIVGNVISRGNPEAETVINSGVPYLSMPQAVSEFFLKDRHSIVVAGTHGKTTTSTLCAWMLESAGLEPGFLIGGVGNNFQVSARIGKPPYFVIEGDEYDTAFFDKGPKFLHYRPQSVILGPVEFDHADIYKDLAHVVSSFEKLVGIIPSDGLLVACADSANTMKIAKKAKCKVVTYGIGKDAGYNPPKTVAKSFPLRGNHNLQNAAGVITLLTELGIGQDKIEKGLKTFKGIKRRQEVRGVVNGITVIDDFAHHPTAISETILAFRKSDPASKLWAIFEPRSNTSKRDIMRNEFAKALSKADVAIIANVFRPEKLPAGVAPLNVKELVREIEGAGCNAYNFPNTEKIIDFIAKNAKSGDIILVMSNGGFDNIHERLLSALKN